MGDRFLAWAQTSRSRRQLHVVEQSVRLLEIGFRKSRSREHTPQEIAARDIRNTVRDLVAERDYWKAVVEDPGIHWGSADPPYRLEDTEVTDGDRENRGD